LSVSLTVIPNLQQVTDVNNVTDNTIRVINYVAGVQNWYFRGDAGIDGVECFYAYQNDGASKLSACGVNDISNSHYIELEAVSDGVYISTNDIVRFDSQGVGISIFTTAEKLALTGNIDGEMIFDSSLGKLCFYFSGAWHTITSV
jgi:hypothetical protein